MPDRTDAFFAYLLATPKSSWTDADKARLQKLADRWIRPGALVRSTSAPGAGPGPDVPTFSGSVVDIVDDKVVVKLNEAIDLSGAGVTGKSDEITVPIDFVELDPGATAA